MTFRTHCNHEANTATRTSVSVRVETADNRPDSVATSPERSIEPFARSVKRLAFGFAFLGATFTASIASAEEDRPSDDTRRVAPEKAWEFAIGSGFSQGFGNATSQARTLSELTRGGLSTQPSFGYRLNPRWMIGVYGEGARYFAASDMPDGTVGYGAAFGAQVQYHTLPFSKLDPWIGLGSGWRGYWVDLPDAGHESLHGFDILRLRVGLDYRLGPSTTIGPMLGTTLTLFESHRAAAEGSSRVETKDPELCAFVFRRCSGSFRNRRPARRGVTNVDCAALSRCRRHDARPVLRSVACGGERVVGFWGFFA